MKKINSLIKVILILILLVSVAGYSQIPNQGNPTKIGMCFPSMNPNNWGSYPNNIFTNQYLASQFVGGTENPTSNPGDFTSDGWPTVDFYLALPCIFKTGTHYVEFVGQADVNLYGSAIAGNLKLSQNYDAATQKTYARFQMNTDSGTFFLSFTNVRSAVVQNILIYGPQYLTGTGASATPISPMPTFINELYTALKEYPSIDFDAVQEPDAQNNGEVSWAGRTLPGQMQYSQAQIVTRIDFYTASGTGNNSGVFYPNNDTLYETSYNNVPINNNGELEINGYGGPVVNGHYTWYGTSSKGMCYEYMIDYANTTGKDIIIYVPECADNEYILNLGLLIKNNLTNSKSHVYVSTLPSVISRPSGGYGMAMALMDLRYNLTDIGFDSMKNSNYKAPNYSNCYAVARYNLYNTFVISTTFSQIFGIQNMMVKYRPLWYPNPCNGDFTDLLTYLNYKTQNPEQYIYALTTVRQFSATEKQDYVYPSSQSCYGQTGNTDATEWTGMPTDSCINRLSLSIGTVAKDQGVYTFASLASWLNMKLILNQSGPYTWSWCGISGTSGKYLAQTDPRFVQMQRNYYQTVWGDGVSEATYYEFMGGPSNVMGIWNAINDSTINPAGGGALLPKYQGVEEALQDKNPGVTMGNILSATLNSTTNIRGGHIDQSFGSINWSLPYSQEDVGWSNPNDSASYTNACAHSPNTWSYMVVSQGNATTNYSYNFQFNIGNMGPSETFQVWLNNRLQTTITATNNGWYPVTPLLMKLKPGQNCIKITSMNKSGTGPYICINYLRFMNPTPFTPKLFSVKVYAGSILNTISGELDTSTLTSPAIMNNIPEGTNLLLIAQSPMLGNGLIDYSKSFEQWAPVNYKDSSILIMSDTTAFEGTGGRFDNIIGIYVVDSLAFKAIFDQADSFEIGITDGLLPVKGMGELHNYYYARQQVPLQAMNYAAKDSGNMITKAVFDRWEGTSQFLEIGYANGGPFVQNPYSDSTTIIVPKVNIWIIGVYRLEMQFELMINYGIPAQVFNYQGQKITIDANEVQPGKAFSQWAWTNDTIKIPLSNFVHDIGSPITYVIQPNMDMEITAQYTSGGDTNEHQLITNDGWITGGTLDPSGTFSTGIFTSNTKVQICAFSPTAGSTFNRWTGDVAYVNNVDTMCAIVTIPDYQTDSLTIVLTATYKANTGDYTLSVENGVCDNGTSIGNYPPGDTVGIGANTPDVGLEFAAWVAIDPLTGAILGDTAVQIADPTSSATYLIMPGKGIIVEATYTTLKYTLTVNNGTGSGKYSVGDEVTIVANPAPVGMIFSKWDGYNFYSLVHDSFASTTYITMTSENVTVDALYKTINPGQVALIVFNGSGGGAYDTSTTVHITAYPPDSAGYAQGYEFDRWTGKPESDIAYLTNGINDINGIVKLPNIPGATVQLFANYQSMQYKLNVERGSVLYNAKADSMYLYGTTLYIQADTATGDSVFSAWIGQTGTISNPTSTVTTITIPDTNITIRATYKLAKFVLTVNNGTGSGLYNAGTIVPIASDYGAAFQVWRGDVQNNVTDTTLSSTTVTMPATNIVIDAIKVPSNKRTVNINVTDVTTFANISDAKVTIFVSGVDTFAAIDSSDVYGNMELLLPAGTYIANATASGYQNDSNAIPLFIVTSGVSQWYIYMQSNNSLKENSLNTLSVYPNPVNDKLHILIPDEQATEVIVTNMLGQPVLIKNVSGSGNTLILDVANLAKGMYNVSIITNGKTYNALFVVE